ncbi:MAG TPA: M48 family metalloprotease [Terriglobales bacterium]|jgi:Zn-dependent protease with chaperone function|nr:M48 family metalloprotease [Terriglobales bacterium]
MTSAPDAAKPDATSDARQLGPRDREAFYKAQSRNRRATWRMSALCFVAALIMGIPLTLVLTPLVYALTLATADVINYFSPLPPEFWTTVNSLGRLAYSVADYFLNHRGTLDLQTLGAGLVVMLAPGIVITFILWTGVLALFRRGGVGGTLASLNAREPNQGDLKELQLHDVVEEMAIAAGLPVPHVMLVDSSGANAAAFGTSPQDARLVVSRRLLDDLQRDELEALLAHLIGSIGNGDLRIAFTVTSVFETCGLLVTLINSPFGKQSRGTLWRILRYGLMRSSSAGAKSAEAETVAVLLTGCLDMGDGDIDRFVNNPKKSTWRNFLFLVFLPIIFSNMAMEVTLWFFFTLLLGPCMALLWRTRRYLADASAVALMRNPDALARALKRLSQAATDIPGGAWASHLFVVSPKGDSSLNASRSSGEGMQTAARAWVESAPSVAPSATSASAPDDFKALRMEMNATRLAAMSGDPQAIERLAAFARAMGAARGIQVPANMPIAADIAAACRGDKTAIARLQALGGESRQNEAKRGSTGLQAQSSLSFHPSLKRRLRRLERMGASYSPEAHGKKSKAAVIIMSVLGLIIGPLLLAAAGMMLVVIAMLVMLNIMIVAIWLVVIHGIFVLLGHAHA